MSGPKEMGQHGHAVRINVRRLRTDRKFTYVELAERLATAGRPIPVLGLRRIERGERRADVDDLVALACVLNARPVDLLDGRSNCDSCHGSPPPGFVCAACRAGESADRD